MADKMKEKILDTSNLPGMSELCDGLEQRYQRILKLKEEFKEIKC